MTKINESAPDVLEFSIKQSDGSIKIVLVDNVVLSEKPFKEAPIEKQIQWSLSAPFIEKLPSAPKFEPNKLQSIYQHIDSDKNNLEGIKPHANIKIKVWWKHSVCGHSYKATMTDRMRIEPYCKLCQYLSQPSYSFLNIQWDKNKNGELTYVPNFKKKFNWICPACSSESQRTINGMYKSSACKNCRTIERAKKNEDKKERSKFVNSSFIERKLFYYFKLIFGEVNNRYKVDKKEVDIFVQGANIAIEYDGYFFHKGKELTDKLKVDKLLSVGIKLIRIREKGLNPISKEDICYDYSKADINKLMHELLNKVMEVYALSETHHKAITEFLKQDIDKIEIPQEYLNPVLPEDSLKTNHPKLIPYWHTEFNTEFDLSNISRASQLTHRAAWWKCKTCKFEWREPIINIIRRPYICHRCELQKYKHE